MKKSKKRLLSAGWLIQVYVFSLALLTSLFAFAQGVITGQMKDRDGKPVKEARGSVKNKALISNTPMIFFRVKQPGTAVWGKKKWI